MHARVVKFGLIAAAFSLLPAAAQAKHAICEEFWKPVATPGVPLQEPWLNASVEAQLMHVRVCVSKHIAHGAPFPSKAIVTVHGSGASMDEFDSDVKPNQYSFVELVAKHGGYATVQIERIGSGLSSHPLAHQVSVDLVVSGIAQIFAGLADGTLDDDVIYADDGPHFDVPPIPKRIYYGKSLATGYGWRLERDYPDAASLFILNGGAHDTPLYWIAGIVGPHFGFPAKDDPTVQSRLTNIAGSLLPGSGNVIDTINYEPNVINPLSGQLGMGYVGFPPHDPANPDPAAPNGWFAEAFIYEQGTHKHVLKGAENRKSSVSSYLVGESAFTHAFAGFFQPCDSTNEALPKSDSCYVNDPVIFMLGDHDGAVCCTPVNLGGMVLECPAFGTLWQNDPVTGAGPGMPSQGIDCSGTKQQTIANFMAAEGPYYNDLEVIVAPKAGHDFHSADSFHKTVFPQMMARLAAHGH